MFCCCQESPWRRNSYRESIYLGLTYSCGGLVHYCHGVEHASLQVGLVMEKEPRVLHPGLQTAGRERATRPCLGFWNPKVPPPHRHTSSKATLPKVPLSKDQAFKYLGVIPVLFTPPQIWRLISIPRLLETVQQETPVCKSLCWLMESPSEG